MIGIAREKFHIRASGEMIVSRLFASLGLAITTAVFSIYLREVGFNDSSIGYVSAGASVLVVVLAPLIPVVLEKFNELKLYVFSLSMLAVLFAGFGYVENILIAVLLFFASKIAIGLFSDAGSIVFRDVSGNKAEFTKAQGLASSLMNVGWIVGPLLGGLILATYNLRLTFIAGAIVMLIAAAIVVVNPIKLKPKVRRAIDLNWVDNIQFFLSRKQLVLAYLQSFGLTAWWSYIWTFIPLFMINQNYSAAAIGLALTLTQVPLTLLEFQTVKLIPKLGYRTIFVGSFTFLATIVLLSLLTSNLVIVLGLLIIGSLALCFLEPISEIFFYEQVTSLEEEKAEPIYRTSHSTGAIAIRLLAGFALAVSGETASYVVLMLLMSVIALSALKIDSRTY